jgi:D-alanine-D-alanine ligase
MKPTSVHLRYEALPADVATIRTLVEDTGVFSPIEVEVAVELVEDRLQRGARSDYQFIFAEVGGRTVGYTCYGPIALTAGSYDLYWIAVDKKCQGQKIGQLLMQKVEERILEANGRNIYIETSSRPAYTATQGFYLRCGYHEEAVLKDFYSPGDDKVIYAKRLAGQRQ